MAVNINQLLRRQSSREMVHRQFSRDVEARLEMNMMGDFSHYHGRRIHYSGESFKIRARSKSEIPARQRQQHLRDRELPDFGETPEEEPEPIKKPEPPKQKRVQLLAPIADDKGLSRVSTATSFVQPTEEGEEPKEAWDSKITYILATVGYAVGLGNVWRFPMLAQENGGGAFLIPYFIMLLIEGLPVFLLELAIGQRLRKGSVGAWQRVSPFLGGLGIASAFVSLTVALYYNTVIAWCLYYFGQSFSSPLPWSVCPKVFDEVLQTFNYSKECEIAGGTQYFWYRETLNIAPGINGDSSFNFTIAFCLLLAWVMVYFCIIKGITEDPIVIYITAIYPYVVLFIFFFRAITLEGMGPGVAHLFTPKWEKLAEAQTWLKAGTQIFFSLGLGFGGLIAYSSYNPANNNLKRDAIFVAITNCSTSIFAGIIIFAILGFKAHKAVVGCVVPEMQKDYPNFTTFDTSSDIFTYEGKEFNITADLGCPTLQKELDNAASGPGLAFILFTEAVNQFPLPNLWAVLFFSMLLALGLDSQFGTLQGVVQCLIDLKLFKNVKKEAMTGSLCAFCFVVSLCFAQNVGMYIFKIFDDFSGNIPLLLIALFECIGVGYFYGVRTLSRDIELMTGSKPSIYWMVCWKYISPLAIIGIFLSSLVQMFSVAPKYETYAWNETISSPLDLKDDVPYPSWAIVIAVLLVLISILWIPIIAVLRLAKVNLLPLEGPGWWPDDLLKEHYSLGEYEDSKLETLLLGHKPDGREGIFFPSVPPYVQANGADGKGGGDVEARSKSPPEMEFDDEPGLTMDLGEEGMKFSSLVVNEEKNE